MGNKVFYRSVTEGSSLGHKCHLLANDDSTEYISIVPTSGKHHTLKNTAWALGKLLHCPEILRVGLNRLGPFSFDYDGKRRFSRDQALVHTLCGD